MPVSPFEHDLFDCLFIGLHPYLSELLFEVVGLRERFSSFRRSSFQTSDEPQKRKKSHKRVSVLFLCGVKLLQDSNNSKMANELEEFRRVVCRGGDSPKR